MDEDVNDGGRFGGRVSVLWKPTENLTITPRLVYQNIEMDGFNREEFFNMFANPVFHDTDTRAAWQAPAIPEAERSL